jgi:hypothetical protein
MVRSCSAGLGGLNSPAVQIRSITDEVFLDASLERYVLLGYRWVPLVAIRVVGGIDCPPQMCFSGLPRQVPASSVIQAPIHRESQKMEGSRPFPLV